MNENLKIKIDPGKLKNMKCAGCQGEIFDIVNELKELPGILSPNSITTTMFIPHFRCIVCGKIFDYPANNNDKKN